MQIRNLSDAPIEFWTTSPIGETRNVTLEPGSTYLFAVPPELVTFRGDPAMVARVLRPQRARDHAMVLVLVLAVRAEHAGTRAGIGATEQVRGAAGQDGQRRVVIETIGVVEIRHMLARLAEGRHFEIGIDPEGLPHGYLDVGFSGRSRG